MFRGLEEDTRQLSYGEVGSHVGQMRWRNVSASRHRKYSAIFEINHRSRMDRLLKAKFAAGPLALSLAILLLLIENANAKGGVFAKANFIAVQQQHRRRMASVHVLIDLKRDAL